MLRGLIIDEWATMWKEAIVACLKVLPGIRVDNRGSVAVTAETQTATCRMNATSFPT